MRLFANANYDFLGTRKLAFMISGLIILPGLLVLALKGVNYSVEFTGGTMVHARTVEPVDIAVVRQSLAANGVTSAQISEFGVRGDEFLVRARVAPEGTDLNDTEATRAAVARALDTVLGPEGYEILEAEGISAKVGSELRQKAFFAILLSFVAVLFYLWYRFEWRFGAAAVAATVHDILASLAFIAIMRVEVSLFVVGALLSVVGYSLNDTIVIFDRVRENVRKSKKEGFFEILNRSINETLPRTALTSGTSLSVLIALGVLGGLVVRPFAVVMFFGILVGTYSSIFVASPILLAIERRWPGAMVRGVKDAGQSAAPKSKRRAPQPVG